MTRRDPPAILSGAGTPHQADPTGSVSSDIGGLGSSGLPPENPWMRRMVYFCAAIGVTLAVLLLLRPQPPPGNLQPRSASCGPCCR